MIDFSMIQYKNEILDALSGLLEIQSVKSEGEASMPYGRGVFDALMYMLDLAEQLDLDNENVFSHVGYAEYGEGEEEVDILTHLDVVPAGDGWTVPPFKATVQDGRIYGRGTMDDKGAAVVALFVLHALKQHCVSLKKRVRLIFGCDEESSWQDMEFYRSRYPKEPAMAFSPDSEYPIVNAEKGTMHIHLKKQLDCAEGFGTRLRYLKGGTRINIVPDSAECFVEGNADLLEKALKLFADGNSYDIHYEKKHDGLYVSAKGVPSHGSLPENGLNAIMILVAFLNNLPMKKSAGSDAVYALGEKIGFETDGKRLKIKSEGSMGALSVNVGIADIGQDSADVALDIRYPECTDTDIIEKALLEAFPGFCMEYAHSMVPHYVSPDSELVRKLGEAYEEVTGEKAECISMGGATYARTFKNSVAFGPVFPGRECREHNSDEYILIDDLIKAGDIMASAIYKLCN